MGSNSNETLVSKCFMDRSKLVKLSEEEISMTKK